MRSIRWAGGAVTAAVVTVVVAFTAGIAAAGINGPCSATIAGQNVAGLSTGATSSAVKVEKGSDVAVTMQANSPMSHLKISISFAGFSWTVKDKEIKTQSWAESVPVDRYATYGRGLYLVTGSSSGSGLSCSGAALVKVEGNPLASVAGGVGLGMTAVGLAGISAAALRARRSGRRSPVSVGGMLAGLLAGLGGGVLLQQFAVIYPTRLVAVIYLVVGLLAGAAIPAIAHVVTAGSGSHAAVKLE